MWISPTAFIVSRGAIIAARTVSRSSPSAAWRRLAPSDSRVSTSARRAVTSAWKRLRVWEVTFMVLPITMPPRGMR